MALNVGELYASFGIDSKGLDGQISGIQKQCESIASGLTKSGAIMTAAVTAPIVKVGKEIFKAGTEFEAQMSKVQAIAGLDSDVEKDAQAINELTQAALEMGSTTQFTATEAGEALEYMAMAGWKTDSMLAGLKPIMDLAAASGESLGKTSDIVTDAMTAFGYTLENCGGDTDAFNEQVTHFSDVLAAAATNANTNVSMMGESFKYVAPLAGTLGYSVDDMAIALGLMANNGIKASQAGTSMRNILQHLIDPTESQEGAMKALGLSLYDSNGKAKDFYEVMGDMRKAAKESGVDMQEVRKQVDKLDEELEKGTITEAEYDKQVQALCEGSEDFLFYVTNLAGARGLSGMLSIMNASDEEFEKMTEAITHCDGATAKMAKTMLDNTKGKITLFKSALEGLEITLWTRIAPAFDKVVETATGWVDSFRKLSPETQTAALKLAGLAAAAGPTMLIMGRIVSAVTKLGPALMALFSPLGIVAGGLAMMAIAAVDADNDIGKMLEEIGTNAATTLSSFDSTIEQTFSDISSRMPALAASLSIFFGTLLPAAINTASTALLGIINTLSENSDEILGVGLSIINGVVEGLSTNLPKLIPAGFKLVAKLGQSIIQAIPVITLGAARIVEAIIKGIGETDFTSCASSILTGINTAITEAATTADGIADTIVGLINTYFTADKIISGLTNATNIANGFFTAITNAFTTIGETGVNIVDKIVNAIIGVINGMSGTEFSGKLGTLATSIINGIVNSLVSLGTAGSDILSSIIDGIATILGKITDGDFSTNMGSVAEAVMTAIGNGIGTIDLASGEIKSNLITSIGGLLGKLTSTDFLSGFTSVASTLIEGLGKAIGGAFRSSGEIIKGIATALSTGLSNGNIGGMLGNLNSLGTAVVGAIAEAIRGAAGSAASIISAVGELLQAALNRGDDDTSILGDLTTLGTSIIDAIVSALGEVAQEAGPILVALSNAISGINWTDVGADLGGFVTALIENLVTAVQSQSFADVVGAIGTAIGSLAGSLTNAAASLVQGLVSAMLNPELWAGLITGIGTILKTTLETARQAIDAWQEAAGLKKTVTQVDSEGRVDINTYLNGYEGGQFAKYLHDKGILSWIGLNDNEEVEFGVTIAPEFEYLFNGEGTEEWLQIVENYRAKVEGREPETITIEQPVDIQPTATGGEESVDVVQQFTDTVNEQLEELGLSTDQNVDLTTSANVTANVENVEVGNDTSIQAEAQTAVDTALAAINLTADVTVATSVTVEISDSDAESVGETLGQGLGDGMAGGISSKSGAVASAAGGLVRVAGSALRSSYTSYSSGVNFGQGFVDGINSKLESVRSAARALASAANNAVSNVTQESSPSRVMIRSGEYFGEGFVIGIHDKVRAVKREASAMATAATNALSLNSPFGIFSDANKQAAIARRNAIDYRRLALAMAAGPTPVLELDGVTVAEVNATNTAKAQNGRTKAIAVRYGSK